MHLIRIFALRSFLVVLILGTVLWLVPRFIHLDAHRESLLEHLNHGSQAKLSIMKAELMLIPHVGLKVFDLSLDSASSRALDGKKIASAKYGEFRLDLGSIFSSPRRLNLHLPEAKLFIDQHPSGWWIVQSLLAQASQGRKTTKPSSQLSQELQKLQQEYPGLTVTVPPEPPPPSIFEKLSFFKTTAKNLHVEIRPQKGPSTAWSLKDVKLLNTSKGWSILLELPTSPQNTLTQALAECEKTSIPSFSYVEADLFPKMIRISNWSWIHQEKGWQGTLKWNGKLQLRQENLLISGSLSSPRCGIR